MGPFSNYVIDAVKKAREIHIDVIGPSHGPVLRSAPWDAVDRYEKWANEVLSKNEVKKVFIGYVTCYGYTKMLADEIAKVVSEAGFEVQMQDVSLISQDESADKDPQGGCNCAIGSPTLNRDMCLKPVWDVLTSVSTYLMKGKPAVAFRLIRMERRVREVYGRETEERRGGRGRYMQRKAYAGRKRA